MDGLEGGIAQLLEDRLVLGAANQSLDDRILGPSLDEPHLRERKVAVLLL